MAETTSVPIHPVAPRLLNGPKVPHIGPDIDAYRTAHTQTIGDGSDEWWAKVARETLYWDRPFQSVRAGGFVTGDIVWFPEGALNASYNCVDRWAHKNPDKTAIIYEADEPGDGRLVTYAELLREVCSIANVLKGLGIKKGDTVSVYLPMTWQSVAAFLACARIGAVHSVVFAGFSSESLRDRIIDCKSRVLLTSDEGRRGGKSIATKMIVDAAVKECPGVEHVLVLKRTGGQVPWTAGRDLWWHEETAKVPNYCPPEIMSSEDPLFILYTSGSTGKPKGVVHTTGGYLLGAALTVKYVFDIHPDDKFACMADIGWITGHTYIVYGPLCNGVTTTVFESTPVYPTPSRYWETVQKHQLTQFYSAPTAIRLLRRLGAHHVEGHDLSSLRVLGSVGEPINPEAWNWYNENVGRKECAVVDTFWQTETGSIVITPFPGAIETKPGSEVNSPSQTQDPRWLVRFRRMARLPIDPNNEASLAKELVLQVRKVIGPFAAPKKILIVSDLPKTRSGKIMRRIMRKIVAGEGDQLGDLSTLAEPSIVEVIKQKVAESVKN
ncbi:hypothetical protein PAXINDRAFT_11037 [Paxillus involutus ATCC 200175]|nr:hypothetical protein PAXINDRAFT_11037 [Paxillus involutus ATCC 200175]